MELVKKLKAFTLVELIIVITILAILATIAFVSFQGYMKDSRDSTRLTTLKNIESGLQAFQINTGNYPQPDNYTLVQASGTMISYQGYIGDTISKQIKINKTPVDPLDQTKILYATSGNKTKYQLLNYLENQNQVGYVSKVIALDYSRRQVKTFGNKVGILLNQDNSPLSLNTIDILKTHSGLVFKSYFLDNMISGSGKDLISLYVTTQKDLSYLDDSLVGYWDMQTIIQSGGLMTLKDFSKYENHGICYDSGFIFGDCGKIGPYFNQEIKGVVFDGVNDHININTTNFTLLPINDYTIISIIETKDTLYQKCVLSSSRFRHGYGSGTYYYRYANTSSGTESYIGDNKHLFNDGNKHVIIGQYILGKEIKFYLDGEYIGTSNILSHNLGDTGALKYVNDMTIGAMGLNGWYSINAKVYGVYVFNKLMTDSQIKNFTVQ